MWANIVSYLWSSIFQLWQFSWPDCFPRFTEESPDRFARTPVLSAPPSTTVSTCRHIYYRALLWLRQFAAGNLNFIFIRKRRKCLTENKFKEQLVKCSMNCWISSIKFLLSGNRAHLNFIFKVRLNTLFPFPTVCAYTCVRACVCLRTRQSKSDVKVWNTFFLRASTSRSVLSCICSTE